MSSGCGDVLSLQDLQVAKKNQIFEAEVITGKQGGTASGANIDYATNQNTGQVQKTMPAILRDIGFTPAGFDFVTGGTIEVDQRDLAVLWPIPDGDGDWYYWEGALPKVIPANSTPATTGGVANGAWRPVGDITLRSELASNSVNKGSSLVSFKGKTVYDELVSSDKRTNTAIDIKAGATRAGIFAQLVRIAGEGTDREIQDFAVSNGSNYIYSLHPSASGSPLTVMTRYPLSGGTIKTQQDNMAGNNQVGHQGLSVERQDSADKLWVTYGLNAHAAMRFDYVAGGAPANIEIYQLFEDSRFSSGSSCNPSLSPDMRFMTGFCLENGTGIVFCRVWDFQKMISSGAGDYTTSWLYEWPLDGTAYIPSTMPVQGHGITGNEIYFWSGGNGTSVSLLNRRLHVYTLDGVLIDKNLNANVGRSVALNDGSGVSYEPEGASIVVSGGRSLLLLGVRSGSSLNPSIYRIWALGIKTPSVSGDLLVSGNYQGSISANDSSGRDYLAIRSRAEGSTSGAGVNYYGQDDNSTPYGINEITGSLGTVRRSVSLNGEQTFQCSSGFTPITVNKPDSGNAIVLQRAGVAIGAMSINTTAFSIFGRGVNIRLGTSDGTTDTNYWEVVSSTGAFRPATDNVFSVGQASLRPSVIYAGTATINTSDESLKTRLSIEQAERDAALEIKKDVWKYLFNDAIELKGSERARIHFGFGAQSVGKILLKHGLDPDNYAFFCFDKWDDEFEPVMGKKTETVITSVELDDGSLVDVKSEQEIEYDTGDKKLVIAAGERYGLRYEELLCFIIAAM